MKNSDRPAYPVDVDVEGVPKDSGTYQRLMDKAIELGNGLTKRERFAMAAMQGLCADGAADSLYPHQISDLSIEIADSLLTKLEVTNETST